MVRWVFCLASSYGVRPQSEGLGRADESLSPVREQRAQGVAAIEGRHRMERCFDQAVHDMRRGKAARCLSAKGRRQDGADGAVQGVL